ncbi:hypothetical protein LLE49_07585 [Alicyclobacillus tolerans]|uniref:hypothetical protein n=1 Tax=Alicyclobacillus tolerans TaxID=90970 RepID=UPI001F349CBE|nr:hypothetical protein [Alicyclobacillus tolerans]MCF8564606.1 hypothetical protein [Alicyclobacillus tolerans]
MKQLTILDWVVRVDVEATKQYYRNLPDYSEACGCDQCKNFVLGFQMLPDPIRSFFTELGVDPRYNAGELYGMMYNGDGTYLYGGWCHIAGELVDGADCKIPVPERLGKGFTFHLVHVNEDHSDLRVGFTRDLVLVRNDFPQPILQLEYNLSVPWVLDSTPE